VLLHIQDENKITIYSSLQSGCNDCLLNFTKESQLIRCPNTGNRLRVGKKANIYGSVFVCCEDRRKSGRRMKDLLELYCSFLPSFKEFRDTILINHQTQFKRLLHNLVTCNAHIGQHIYSLLPEDQLTKAGTEVRNTASEIIKSKPNEAARVLLKVLKNSNHMQAEFTVFNKLYAKDVSIELKSHSLHKILLVVLNSFWYDFIVNSVEIQIGKCYEKVEVDYETIAAALTHVLDNITKYIAHGSDLIITFKTTKRTVKIIFEMISMRVEDIELKKIFNEGYSGKYPSEKSIAGNGIGFFMVRKLLALNNSEIRFIPRYQEIETEINIDGIPYDNNRVELIFKRKK